MCAFCKWYYLYTTSHDKRIFVDKVDYITCFGWGEGGAAAFLEQRRQQIDTGRPPEPKLEDVTVTAPSPDRRVVTFVQRFGEGAVRKELTLALEGQLWRIVAERTLGML